MPQIRNRIFIVGFNKDYFKNEIFNYPKPLNKEISFYEIKDEKVDKKYFMSKVFVKNTLFNDVVGKCTINENICRPILANCYKNHRASAGNYYTDDVNFNLFEDDSKTNIRKITPNECRKLQGFPSDWKQVVSDTQAYKQFGNAVSVDVVYYLLIEIKKYIQKNQIV